MPSINQLSAVDSLQGGDQLAVWSTAMGDTRRSPLTVLVEFLATAFSTLSVSSYVKTPAVPVAELPSAAEAGAGARSMVTDASATTFASTVGGGGSNIVPVVSNGTDWIIG